MVILEQEMAFLQKLFIPDLMAQTVREVLEGVVVS
jgi:hypothetical protein